MSKNPVVHFEMPYNNAGRVSKFYEDAFGWKMVNVGEVMGNYVTAETAETDENQMVTTPGTINGGFYPLSSDQGTEVYKEPSVVISVNDINETMEDIKKAGGEILREPQEIPGIGTWATFRDTEGNRVSILKATPPQA